MKRPVLPNLTRVRRVQHGASSFPDAETLALNLSYVVHNPSGSDPVQRLVTSAVRDKGSVPLQLVGELPMNVDWIVPSIGQWSDVPTMLGVAPEAICWVDRDPATDTTTFFGAPAALALPTSSQLAIAWAPVRPGGKTAELQTIGPVGCNEALRALERIIREHADQWYAPRALWVAPAEVLLADEVY